MDLFSVAPIWDSHEDVEGHLHPERNHLSSESLHQYLHIIFVVGIHNTVNVYCE